MRDWSVGLEEEQQKRLHVEGERELEGLGERWHSRFPKLLDDYTPGDFVFRWRQQERFHQDPFLQGHQHPEVQGVGSFLRPGPAGRPCLLGGAPAAPRPPHPVLQAV